MKILLGRVVSSKTIWLGILMLVAAILEYLAGAPENVTLIQAISGILTIVIRFLTNDGLTEK